MDAEIRAKLNRPIVLIGLMGAGKSKMGQALAARLGLDFVDSDAEIVAAEGREIAAIFAAEGEAYFRRVERDTIARLIERGPMVIATGGGAVMTPETADIVFDRALTVWLKADLDVLLGRVTRNIDKRPLLAKGDPAEILQGLMDKRYPVYARAAVHVPSLDAPIEENLNSVVNAIAEHLS